jgi:hypothetical protein
MAQKLYGMASDRTGIYEAAQREFNEQQMLPRESTPSQQTMQQQQQIQPKREDE